MIQRISNKINRLLFRRSIPEKILQAPSEKEKQLIEELRKNFQMIDTTITENTPTTDIAWINNIKQVKNLVLNNDPREFLKWEIIKYCMYISYADYAITELNHLKSLKDYSQRWLPAIQESTIGAPLRYKHLAKSSANLVTHAYHLAMLEENAQMNLSDVDFVFEFGGGYGNMCKLVHNLGYNKKYLIFDLAPFSALQEFYLKSLGLKLLSKDNFLNEDSGILCISKLSDLKELLQKANAAKLKSLFIATWSISETPKQLREKIIPLIKNFSFFLIGYADKWGDVENISYFKNLRKEMDHIIWKGFDFPFLFGNFYLVGKTTSLTKDTAKSPTQTHYQ